MVKPLIVDASMCNYCSPSYDVEELLGKRVCIKCHRRYKKDEKKRMKYVAKFKALLNHPLTCGCGHSYSEQERYQNAFKLKGVKQHKCLSNVIV